MYNRYISQHEDYGPIPPPHREGASPPSPGGRSGGGLGGLLKGLLRTDGGRPEDGARMGDKVDQAISALCKTLGLKELGTGDILLALIVLLLILEDGDDLELLIALGLMLVMHLGEP